MGLHVSWPQTTHPASTGIVITDLDGFADSDEEEDGHESTASSSIFEVHPKLLAELRNKKFGNHVVPTSGGSQALILFKPPPALPALVQSPVEEEPLPPTDEYAMDLDS
jgi:hypothetical protein